MAQVLCIIGFSFALPFLPFFIRDLGITDPAQQAWWAGILLGGAGVTLALFAPLWGVLADRYGRKAMVMRSMFSGALVILLMSFSRNVIDLLICRMLQGALTGTIAASIALVASVTPLKHSGFALGMMQAAVFLGMAIGPLLGGLAADHYGYRFAFRAGAFVILLGGLLIHYGTQESFSPPDTEDDHSVSIFKLLKDRSLLAAILILLGIRFSITIVNPSFPLIIQDILVSPERLNSITGMVMAFSGLTGAVAAGVLGYAGDRLGHRRVIIVCILSAGAAAAAHAVARSIMELTIYHLFFGMTISGILPAANAMIQGSTNQQNIGKAFGIATSISMIGMAFGPFVGGFFASQYGLRSPFLIAGVCQLALAVIIMTSRRGR